MVKFAVFGKAIVKFGFSYMNNDSPDAVCVSHEHH